MDDLEKTGRTHPTPDAHGDNGVLGLAPAALDQSMTSQARAGHAIGMTEGDRSTVDVELFRIDAELIAALDHLDRKRLIQFPKPDIVDRQSVPLQKPGHGIDRADPHLEHLLVSRRQVVPDRPAEDVLLRTLARNVLAVTGRPL